MSRDLAALLEHPNVRRYLDLIAQAEGTAGNADPYRVAFGGGTISDLSRHPGVARRFRQTDGKSNTSTAAGKYQFLHSTWADVSGRLGLTDFSPRSQDLGALELMRRSGSLEDVLRGDYASAVRKDGRTWASLPSSPYPQPKRSAAFIAKALGQPEAPTFLPPYAPLAAALGAPLAQPHYRPTLPPSLPAPPPAIEPSHAVHPMPVFTSPRAAIPPWLVPSPEPPYSIDLDLQQLRRPPSTP
jgi:muramidase (phage lysozyme)